MREHKGIIKIESLLVKSMDEWKIFKVASSSPVLAPFLNVARIAIAE
jgi:hypothetical protein